MENSTQKNYLEQDGGLILNLGIYKHFSSIGDGAYSEICGGFIEGVYQWSDHNIDTVDECSNDKYTGWTVYFNNGSTGKIYIENWVMNFIEEKCNNWKHAKNMFTKYVKSVRISKVDMWLHK